MCSTYAAQEKSKLGKAARQAMRYPHTSGRKGQARVADELEITRTDVWLEAHTKKDGSASCEETERGCIIHENNPSFAQGHLDQEPMARVCGCDTRGHVKGMGSRIKYAMSRSAPYKRALEPEKKSNVTLHTEVEQLKEQMREMQQILASHGWRRMQFSSNHGSSSQVRQDSSRQEAQSDQATTDQSSSPLLKLLHLTKIHVSHVEDIQMNLLNNQVGK